MLFASDKPQLLRSRVVSVFIGLTLAWSFLLLRSAQLQILPNSRLAELQKRQYNTLINLPARRGLVTDRKGHELAATVPTFSAFADPKIIENSRQFSRQVGKKLGISPERLKRMIKNKNKRFVWLRRDFSKKTADDLQAMKLRGLGVVEESKRVYPNEHLLSQVLGFVGQDGHGLEGLEKYHELTLRGESRKVQVERDARGRPLLIDGRVFADYPAGYDVELTIDSDLQFQLEKELSGAVQTFNADSAVGVIMNPHTGEILAMANAPTFNSNEPFRFNQDYWRNRAVTDAFEQGSTIKTLLVATGLKNGIAPNKKFYCEQGKFKIGKHFIRESDTQHKFENLTVTEILAKSSNVGTSKIALKLGDKKVRDGLREFGIGERLGVELPGEANGVVHGLPWRDHLLANISFGHGLTATPLQITNAYSAIANGGELKKPFLVRRALNAETRDEKIFEPTTIRRVLTANEAQTMRLMLHSAVSNTGTGYAAQVKGYPVAGKTGTAQKIVEGLGYKSGAYVSSFVGFIPVQNPQFVIYIAVDNPREKYYGAEVAAPVFSKVANYAVRQAGLPPVILSEENVITQKKLPTEEEKSITKIREMARVLASEEKNETPDFKGLTVREVLNRVRGTPIKVQLQGRGVVSMSVPDAGEPLPESRTVKIFLGPVQ